MTTLKIYTFKEKQPRRGDIICFDENTPDCDFYHIDYSGCVYSCFACSEVFYACKVDELEDYGRYTHWARTNKVFNVKWDIPKE